MEVGNKEKERLKRTVKRTVFARQPWLTPLILAQ